MEKSMKPKSTNIISFFPKSSTFTHHRSHGGDISTKNHRPYRRGFSGPMVVSIVPAEARKSAGTEEPTSPTVSCIGQIKQRKKAMKDMYKKQPPAEKKKKSGGFHNIFRRKYRPEKEPEATEAATMAAAVRAPPKLGQMKRFSSGHETLGRFDWSKVERRREEEDEEEEIIIPHSAPMMLGSGGAAELEGKKEINLWKRRGSFAPVAALRL